MRLTCGQVKSPILNHLSTLKQILYFHKCLNLASASFFAHQLPMGAEVSTAHCLTFIQLKKTSGEA